MLMSACLVLATMGCAAPSGLTPDGCFYIIDGPASGWNVQEWRAQLDAMEGAGLRHVILAGPELQRGATQPAEDAWDTADRRVASADRLMEAALGRPQRIYLCLWANPRWYADWDLAGELAANRLVIQRLTRRYGHHPNFAGWYIPHEIYVVWDAQRDYIRGLYAGLSAECKKQAPGKPVILSPFFILDRQGVLGGFRFAEPDEYQAFWTELLAATQIDIVALQDSGEHLSCYTPADRRPFLEAMKRACAAAGKTFWVNVETGELHVDSYADYERRFGRRTHVNDPRTQPFWRAVPPDKLQAKLRLAHEYAKTTITWGYQQYWDPMRGEALRARYDAVVRAAGR
jgi:hypothetical protein